MFSGQSSLLETIQNTVRAHMLTKKEIISGFCLAPLTLYGGLKTKDHLERLKQAKSEKEFSKSLQKMFGWTVAGGLCNYTVYQNIEHLFKNIPLQKKKIFTSSAAHSAFLLLYAVWSNNNPPNAPHNQNKDNKENNSTEIIEGAEHKDMSDNESIEKNFHKKPHTEVNSPEDLALELANTKNESRSKARFLSPSCILLIAFLTIIELKLLEFIFKSNTAQLNKPLAMKMIKIFINVLFCRILIMFKNFSLFTFLKKKFHPGHESSMKELRYE